jgi:hypothetical protein
MLMLRLRDGAMRFTRLHNAYADGGACPTRMCSDRPTIFSVFRPSYSAVDSPLRWRIKRQRD